MAYHAGDRTVGRSTQSHGSKLRNAMKDIKDVAQFVENHFKDNKRFGNIPRQ